MAQMMRPNMGDRSEEAKPEPTNQQVQGSQVSAAAPPNQPAAAGRLPLFRK
jgi:hypothetical protein